MLRGSSLRFTTGQPPIAVRRRPFRFVSKAKQLRSLAYSLLAERSRPDSTVGSLHAAAFPFAQCLAIFANDTTIAAARTFSSYGTPSAITRAKMIILQPKEGLQRDLSYLPACRRYVTPSKITSVHVLESPGDTNRICVHVYLCVPRRS